MNRAAVDVGDADPDGDGDTVRDEWLELGFDSFSTPEVSKQPEVLEIISGSSGSTLTISSLEPLFEI